MALKCAVAIGAAVTIGATVGTFMSLAIGLPWLRSVGEGVALMLTAEFVVVVMTITMEFMD